VDPFIKNGCNRSIKTRSASKYENFLPDKLSELKDVREAFECER
jgi:hypothetical protein